MNIRFVLTVVFLLIPVFVFAQGLIPCNGPDCSICDLLVLINNIYLFVITWSPIVAVFRIGYAGILMIINGSNSTKVGEARKSIQDTLLWLVIIYCSFLIVNVVIHLVPVKEELKGSWYKFTCESKDPGLGGQGLTRVRGGVITLDGAQQIQPRNGGANKSGDASTSGSTHQGEYVGSLSYPKGVGASDLNDCLNNIVRNLSPDSPLNGKWFADAGSRHNVNPAFLIAIAQVESTLASRSVTGIDYSKADPKLGGRYNIGNITDGRGGYVNYTSYANGIDAKAKYLADLYLYTKKDKPLTTIRAIAYTYCPPVPDLSGNKCDTEAWIRNTSNLMKKIDNACGGKLQVK